MALATTPGNQVHADQILHAIHTTHAPTGTLVAAALAGCGQGAEPGAESPSTGGGRAGLKVGNTEVVANMIADLVPCDVYRIEAAEPYSDRYDDTVARNVLEQDSDARPARTCADATIAEGLPVRGEQVQRARSQVTEWLSAHRAALTASEQDPERNHTSRPRSR